MNLLWFILIGLAAGFLATPLLAAVENDLGLEAFQIEGVKTTIPLHKKILSDPRFSSGTYTTALIGKTLLIPVA